MSKFSRRKPTSKRSEPILPGCHHPPPPPVKSRSFDEMRKQAVESQRKKFEEEPLEESFYAQNHLLALMDEACRIMDSQPSEDEVSYSSIESQYEYDVQLEQTRQCDFSFETEDLPPCPDFKLESFLPPVFLSTARKKTFDNMVQRIKTEPRIHNLIQEKLTSLSKHPGRFQDTYGSQGNDKTYVSCDPGSFFFRDIAQHDSDPDLNFQPSRYKDHYLYSTDIVFRNLIDFDERKIKVPPEFKSLIRFFFIPSSGGKSSFKALRNKSERYYDSDDLIRDNYPFYLQVKRYGDIIGDRGILNLFWKISFHIMYPVIYDKIILFNHPNQIPYPYLSTFNSFVILPLSFRYGDKFFNQNYYSLLCYDFYSLGISISFLEYSDYFDFIRDRVLNGRNSKLFDSLTIRP